MPGNGHRALRENKCIFSLSSTWLFKGSLKEKNRQALCPGRVRLCIIDGISSIVASMCQLFSVSTIQCVVLSSKFSGRIGGPQGGPTWDLGSLHPPCTLPAPSPLSLGVGWDFGGCRKTIIKLMVSSTWPLQGGQWTLLGTSL